MSHFAEIEVNFDQKNEKDLVKALETQFGEGNVEVHEEGTALYGYGGDNRSTVSPKSPDYAPPCHIVIRRKHVGSAANDVGYRRTEDGKYVAYISDYDKGHTFTTKKQGAVSQEYALQVAERKLKAEGWSTKRVKAENGKIQVHGSKWTK